MAQYFSKVLSGTTRPVATTLSAQKLSEATTATITAATGWDDSTPVHGIMYRTDAGTGAKVAGSQIDWKADLSGTTLSNFTVTAGTDDTYAIGTTVELAPTAAWGDDMATGILVEHNQDGTHGAVTTTSLLTTGDITVSDTKAIKDANGNGLVKFSQTASAVNEVTVTNAATGNAPQISATGGDTNIDLNFAPKGTGAFKVGGNVFTHGALTSYTPTYTNITVGNGTVVSKYCRIGTLVVVKFIFTLGSTSSVGNDPKITLPFTADSGYVVEQTLGHADFLDAGTAVYVGRAYYASTTTVGFRTHANLAAVSNITSNSSQIITATAPMTWTTGDSLIAEIVYEAA